MVGYVGGESCCPLANWRGSRGDDGVLVGIYYARRFPSNTILGVLPVWARSALMMLSTALEEIEKETAS